LGGSLGTLGCSLKITKVAQIVGPFFPRYKLYVNFGKKMVWAILSQIYLVTLVADQGCPLPLYDKQGDQMGDFSPIGRLFTLSSF
jgi:hypothetical protein